MKHLQHPGKLICLIVLLTVFSPPVFGQWISSGGNPTFNNAYPSNYNLTIDSSNNQYIAFADNGNLYTVTVKKLAPGETWQNLGTPGFITGSGPASGLFYNPGISIAVNPVNGMPYIALSDGDHENRISVMRFNNSAWEYAGTPGFTPPNACGNKLCFSPDGTAYVSFVNCFIDNGISVMKLNTSGDWVFLGSQNFATGNYAQPVAYGNDSLAVAYKDEEHENKLSVMRFNGSWQFMGQPGISTADATAVAIAADAGGVIVAYSDYGNGEKISVKKFGQGMWSNLGAPFFSNSAARNIDLTISRFGEPHVSFTDNIFPVAKKFNGSSWMPVGNSIINAAAYHTSIVTDTFGLPSVLVGLQSVSISLPFVFKYSPCNDPVYNFQVTAAEDSAISQPGGTTTVTVSATGGAAPYTGTGNFSVTAGSYYYTVSDRSGCSKTIFIDVFDPPPPCIQNYWTGNSSDWNDPSNWSCGTVPNDSTEVFIEEGYSNYPVIDTEVICKQLNAAPNTTVTIADGGKLRILVE